MSKNHIQVVALVVDSGILTFYKTDGSVFTITQGDPRGPAMSESFLLQRQQGKEIIELQLEPDDKVISNLSGKSRNPLIKFFRARLSDVAKLFGNEIDHNLEGAATSHEAAAQKVRDVAAKLFAHKSTDTVQPSEDLPIRLVTSEEGPLQKDETIIAVTQQGIVPEIESISEQYKASDEGKASSTGPDNLILRLAAMSAKRAHTAQELIRFIKGIDLPILPDGSFLAYKRLLHQGNGVYVDPHSKKVHQRIGDIVQMDEALIDTNRRTLCSTGLHVGTRHYMGGFHANSAGSGTMLVLVQPEDAIAVPQNETSKGRMARYTIICDLSDKAHSLVNNKQKIDDCKDTMALVAQIVAGARPPMLGVVNISGTYGDGLTYTINGQSVKTNVSLDEARQIAQSVATAPTTIVKPVETIDDKAQGKQAAVTLEKIRTKEAVVKPTEAKAKMVAQAPVAGASERVKKATELYAQMTNKNNTDSVRKKAAEELKAFKKKAKVGFPVLGLPVNTAEEIQEILILAASSKPVAQPKPSKPAPAPEKKQIEPVVKAPEPVLQNETRGDKVRRLWAVILDSRATSEHKKTAAQDLKQLKKTTKVSWGSLGLGDVNVEDELKKYLG
jgi:hypothetical protein